MSNRRKSNNPREKDSEWQERVIQVRRVTKVCKGGKKLSFRTVVVIGNEKGKVGVGVGKAADVVGAVKKAVSDGKKHLVTVSLTKNNSVPHVSNGIAGAAKVFMRPAAEGCGVIAGGSVRTVLELAGVKNILTKQLGSNNPLNNACATVDALKNLKTYSSTMEDRKVLT
uniref:Small ribosomal subunit protein uS5c n=1 Tax=Haptophyceae sp. NIES-3900 TaxID=2748608 RepID=A0A7R6WD84_9EUKA|nr:ribosomal protein S5 [Haptophyceae sp. NIES-3900]